SQQNKKTNQQKRFQQKPHNWRQDWSEPTTQKENCNQGGDERNAEVLANEEHSEFHARVFGMEPGDQLAFGFRQIERQPACFGDSRYQKEHKAEKLRNDKPEAALGIDDLHEIERAGEQHDAHD